MTSEEVKMIVEQLLAAQTRADAEPARLRAALETAQRENELLRQQLTMAQALLEAKEETLALLRGGHNRPN